MTPEEEKADELTPADLRRRQRSGALVFGLFLAVVLAALITTVLAVNDGRNYRRLAIQLGLERYLLPAIAPADIRIDRLTPTPVADSYPPWLMRAGLERTAVFEKPVALTTKEQCNQLKGDGAGDVQFTNPDGATECIFLREIGTAAPPASLFVQARWAEPDVFRSFRMKLNLTDPAAEAAVLREAAALTARFGLPMTPETKTYLSDMLQGRREFESTVEDYRMTFTPEMMDQRRYNLLILPLSQKMKCGDKPSEPGSIKSDLQYHMPIGCRLIRGAKPLPQS